MGGRTFSLNPCKWGKSHPAARCAFQLLLVHEIISYPARCAFQLLLVHEIISYPARCAFQLLLAALPCLWNNQLSSQVCLSPLTCLWNDRLSSQMCLSALTCDWNNQGLCQVCILSALTTGCLYCEKGCILFQPAAMTTAARDRNTHLMWRISGAYFFHFVFLVEEKPVTCFLMDNLDVMFCGRKLIPCHGMRWMLCSFARKQILCWHRINWLPYFVR